MTEIVDESSSGVAADRPTVIRLRQQALVAEFGLFALRSRRLDEVLHQACEVASNGLSTAFAKVLQYRAASRDLLLCSGVGWRPGVVGNAVLGCDLASPAGFALRTSLPVLSNHLAGETRFRTPAVLADHGVCRAINVIIEGATPGSDPFGVLEADSSDRYSFAIHDVAFMQSLANVLSASITRHIDQAAREQLLHDKDVLMQEVHHRIKNSLQLVQTMLHLQARSLAQGEERNCLSDAAARIMSIAAVHRRLHEDGVVEQVDLGAYLSGLIADLWNSMFGEEPTRPVVLDVDPMQLTAEHVTPVGLIVVELVTNAVKYGAGSISIRVRRSATGVVIDVADEGTGFPPGFEVGSSRSLGMRLIVALARTRDAVVLAHGDGHTQVSVTVTFALPAGRGVG